MAHPLPPDVIARLAPHVPLEDLQAMLVDTGLPARLVPWAFRASATTLGRRVCMRPQSYRVDTPWGLALLAHEAGHIRQWRELGAPRFLARYIAGSIRTRFRHNDHPMEAELVAHQRQVRALLEGSTGQADV